MKRKISRPAVKIVQNERTIYLSSFTIRDLMEPGFYRVDRLDAKRSSKKYQRHLDERRAKTISNNFVDSWKEEFLFLPTSLFLATDKTLKFANGRINFDASDVCPFDVVDGQHRIEALKKAAKEESGMETFEVGVTVAESLEQVHQMVHFYIVNTQQKSVDKGLEDDIIARLTDMKDFDAETVHLPSAQLKLKVRKRVVMKAVDLVDHLNQESPWKDRIEKSGSPEKGKVKRAAVTGLLGKFVLTPSHPLHSYDSRDAKKILVNYWRAIEAVFVPPKKKDETVVFKNNGIWFFLFVSSVVISWLVEKGDFRVSAIKEKFEAVLENLDSEAEKIASQDWWLVSRNGSGGGAGKETRASLLDLAKKFQEAVTEARKQEKKGGIRL